MRFVQGDGTHGNKVSKAPSPARPRTSPHAQPLQAACLGAAGDPEHVPPLLLPLLSALRLLSDSNTTQPGPRMVLSRDIHTASHANKHRRAHAHRHQMDAFLAGPRPSDRSIISSKSARQHQGITSGRVVLNKTRGFAFVLCCDCAVLFPCSVHA